jgi:acyl-CoA synthetase (AMP-forming)/AMP-acid ligase II
LDSSGTVLPLYDFRIVDETGTIALPGQIGDICLKGDCLALLYLGEINSTDFFATGDLGYLIIKMFNIILTTTQFIEYYGYC